jgi:hypothetical protein
MPTWNCNDVNPTPPVPRSHQWECAEQASINPVPATGRVAQILALVGIALGGLWALWKRRGQVRASG